MATAAIIRYGGKKGNIDLNAFLNSMEAYSISEAFLGFRWLSEGCYHLENYFANNMYYSVESFGIIMAGELRYRIKI